MSDALAARVPAVASPGAGEDGRGLSGGLATGRRRLSGASGPRRVSGPAGGRGGAPPRSGGAAPRSGRGARNRGAARGLAGALGAVPLRSLEALRLAWLRVARGLPVERVSGRSLAHGLRGAVLGRTWIAVVAFALIGIVTLQLGLLKLNSSIGRGLEHEALLQRQNAQLSIENSEMGASASVESRAEHMGMELVPPEMLRPLSVRGFDAGSAASVLSAPIGSTASGSSETPGSSAQGQSGASTPGAAGSSSSTESSGQTSASGAPSAASGTDSSGSAGSEPGASNTAASPPPTAAPEEHTTTPAEQTAAPSPTGTPSAGTPAAGGSGEAQPAGGTQSAAPGG